MTTKNDKQFTLPAYVTMRFADTYPDIDYSLLGVALDEEVAISRLTLFMVEQRQAITFTELDEEELTVWASNHFDELEKGTWRVSANRRLWIGCGERIEVVERDAMAQLEAEL
ncbi:hypothetical protein [Nonomuraea typhae]|uniref:Uncharacterized protein n=1 Tax=Nonomuraea typhae TaxID=2603600 RepID=A0ABW7YJB2_9ACTN